MRHADLAGATWRKSSFSSSGECVEVAPAGEGFAMRDSKNPAGPTLSFPAGEWRQFLAGLKDS
ncbi:DUF397 domain-containing protein [Saccharothrix sp. S26]|uniref:DUF397 domain-containing protein n=1 Tax=Saccharothrix sp. S26 TaxID=2907215 RepID=UPI001F355FF2|nr:DUF397 domain-containing protein [Saccharothrix sp. S26]MCE6994690.1 DUF397 domain-containing protein [Saccharothrix sp. S26]